MSLEQELKMQKFSDEYQRAYLNIVFTANYLESKLQQELKTLNLTPSQFNVLRILRGQKGCPMSALAIQERMIHRTSNVTRIIEKLVEKDLVTRQSRPDNRRMIDVAITQQGLEMLQQADAIALRAHKDIESALTTEEARQLGDWMDAIRDANRDQ